MSEHVFLDLSEVESRVCDVLWKHLGVSREEVRMESRLIEDLQCDSLDLLELIMELEDEFDVTIPNEPSNPVGKTVFARQPFRVRDFAEVVYLHQGTGKPTRAGWKRRIVSDVDSDSIPFSQLSGRWEGIQQGLDEAVFESLGRDNGVRQFRRFSDGMRCVLLPSVEFNRGSDGPESHPDEQPVHSVRLDSFLIDCEPVSTAAYCRFLNSVVASETDLRAWFVLEPNDDRIAQMPIVRTGNGWRPLEGTRMMPMVLVSWLGANAYSLWANGKTWSEYATHEGFLPSEAQWEHAAQGAFPDSETESTGDALLVCGQHERGARYDANTMPMAAVHLPIGRSTFGLHHMAGNVWQWCRDWYGEGFYQRPESRVTNPVDRLESGVRSERGGSWVGPIELCRTSYRRGRSPIARGRCLGFRCVGSVEDLPG